jgi:rod shape-determining protein MreC
VFDNLASSGVLSSRRTLARDNESLRAELAALREETSRARALEAENQILREITDVVGSRPGVTAPVLSTFRASPYGTFIVGAGKSDGVSVGSLVLTQGGFVLGQVTEAGVYNSTVKAVLSPGVDTDVLLGETGAVVRGEGGGNGFSRVSRESLVSIGDPVVAPMFGQRPIAVVADIERDEASPSADVFVRIPVNLENLRFVYVEL